MVSDVAPSLNRPLSAALPWSYISPTLFYNVGGQSPVPGFLKNAALRVLLPSNEPTPQPAHIDISRYAVASANTIFWYFQRIVNSRADIKAWLPADPNAWDGKDHRIIVEDDSKVEYIGGPGGIGGGAVVIKLPHKTYPESYDPDDIIGQLTDPGSQIDVLDHVVLNTHMSILVFQVPMAGERDEYNRQRQGLAVKLVNLKRVNLKALAAFAFLPESWAAVVKTNFQLHSAITLNDFGITIMAQSLNTQLYPPEHRFAYPFHVVIFSEHNINLTCWTIIRQPAWARWNVRYLCTITEESQRARNPDAGDITGDVDIYVQVPNAGVYHRPPVEKWAEKGYCRQSNGRFIDDYDVVDGWTRSQLQTDVDVPVTQDTTLVLRFQPVEPSRESFVTIEWGPSEARFPGRICTSEAYMNEDRGLVAIVYWRKDAGGYKTLRTSRPLPKSLWEPGYFKFPLPVSTEGTEAATTVRDPAWYNNKSTLFPYTDSDGEARVVYTMQAWLLMPEYGMFWKLRFRPDRFPNGWVLQGVVAHWSAESADPVKEWVITPAQPQNARLTWPLTQRVFDTFKAATTVERAPPHLFKDIFTKPIFTNLPVYSLVTDGKVGYSGEEFNTYFYPLGWFEQYDRKWWSEWNDRYAQFNGVGRPVD